MSHSVLGAGETRSNLVSQYHNSENQIEAQFRAIHYAWAIERGYCIGDIKIILWHPHRLDTNYVKFFSSIKNRKIILCCRSQVSSLISTQAEANKTPANNVNFSILISSDYR